MAFTSPIDDRWFEDYVPGETHDCGTFSVTEAEIIEFATRFDPQPFHLDREVAAKSVFGGLVASGMHTTALMMRQFVDHYISTVASVGGLGTDSMASSSRSGRESSSVPEPPSSRHVARDRSRIGDFCGPSGS